MATTRQIIKNWFSNFKKPTQEQFWAWIDSFWHKDDKIPMQQVEGLEKALQNVPTADQFGNHLTDEQAHKSLFDSKVDKEQGKGLISDAERTLIQENFNKRVVSHSITGDVNKVSTMVLEDGSVIQAHFTDVAPAAPDVMLNSLNFNTETGVLTGVRSDGQQLTVDLNGRFALLNHTHQISDITGLQDALNEKANANHMHSYNDLTDKPTLFSGDYNDLTNKPTYMGIKGIPFREVIVMVNTGQPFKIPKLDTYEYTDAIKIISESPITGLSNVGLTGNGEKSVTIPSYWRNGSNTVSTSYFEADLYTDSPQVTIIYYINNLENYLNRFGAKEYYFKYYKIDGSKVKSLLNQMRSNVEGFTKLVIGRIPEIYNSISDVSGLQDKGFLSFIPESYCRKKAGGIFNVFGRHAKIIYADLSGQTFVLNHYVSTYQGGNNPEHYVNLSYNFTWERYEEPQAPQVQAPTQQTDYEFVTSSNIELTPENSNTHFIYTNETTLNIDFQSPIFSLEGKEWFVYFTGRLLPNGQQNGGYGDGYGGGYGNYPIPIRMIINNQATYYSAFPNNEASKGDKARIFVKDGTIYIVKD